MQSHKYSRNIRTSCLTVATFSIPLPKQMDIKRIEEGEKWKRKRRIQKQKEWGKTQKRKKTLKSLKFALFISKAKIVIS